MVANGEIVEMHVVALTLIAQCPISNVSQLKGWTDTHIQTLDKYTITKINNGLFRICVWDLNIYFILLCELLSCNLFVGLTLNIIHILDHIN